MKLYGDIRSGNCYKIVLLAHRLELPFAWQYLNILKSETQTAEFLSKNPNGKIPCLEIGNGTCLAESNAILNYLADGTDFLPADKLRRAQVLQWQFFEQYSHEPFIAVARYIAKYLGLPAARKAEYESKQAGGHKALAVMEQQLKQTPYLVGDRYTIADISLYAYTHVAHEGGFDLSSYPHINAWLQRVAAQPRHITMDQAEAEVAPSC